MDHLAGTDDLSTKCIGKWCSKLAVYKGIDQQWHLGCIEVWGSKPECGKKGTLKTQRCANRGPSGHKFKFPEGVKSIQNCKTWYAPFGSDSYCWNDADQMYYPRGHDKC